MKKNSIYKLFILLLPLLIYNSCSDFMDVNKDPRYPAVAGTPLLFSSGVTWSASRLGRDGQLVGALWMQHYAQNNAANQYKPMDSYNVATNSTEPTAIWQAMYSGALPDFRIAITQAEASGEWNYWLPSKVMMAFDFHILASFFETIPFSEALVGEENLAPKYDDGPSVDAGIIKLLDDAIAKKSDAAALASIGTKDFVFGGNIDNWVKFAKTLKLKILMRSFDTNKSAIQALLTENDLLTTADARMTGFVDEVNKSNPLYESDRRALNTTENIRLSATLVDFLLAYKDPRIAIFGETVTKNTDGSAAPANTYRGLDQGSADSFTQAMFPTPAHSRARLAATDPVYFLSVAECYFLKAEAYARLGDAANAKTNYDSGVKAAFTRWNLDGSPFVAAGGAYEFQSGNQDAMLKSILTQKWIASARCQAWDAFFDQCRTGIPAIGSQTVDLYNAGQVVKEKNPAYVLGTLAPSIYSVLPAGDFPRRFLYVKTSSDYNPNAPKADDNPISKKMWWHK